MNHILTIETQENSDLTAFLSLYFTSKETLQQPRNSAQLVEISPNKFLYLNMELDD